MQILLVDLPAGLPAFGGARGDQGRQALYYLYG